MVGGNWVIKNPNTGADVARGANAKVYAYALDNLADFIKYNEQMPFYFIPFNKLISSLSVLIDSTR